MKDNKFEISHQYTLQFDNQAETDVASKPVSNIVSFSDFRIQKKDGDIHRLAFERLVSHAKNLTW